MSSLAIVKNAPTYPNVLDYAGYWAFHTVCLGALWTGVSRTDLVVCAASYLVRMVGVMLGFHRYFSHRAFKATRGTQFALALLGTLGVQKGVLWWAAHHRAHHRYSDTERDVHSPVHRPMFYAHCGWHLDKANRGTDYTRVTDLMKHPEIVWLNDWNLIPPTLYAVVIWLVFGTSGLIWGFFISTILLWHAIHAIGSFGHRFGGYRRFATTDNSRNKWFLAILLLGEGWHNNHHFYPSSARQGFVWWEYDVGYYVLKLLSWLRLASDLRLPPEHFVRDPLPAMQSKLRRFSAWVQDLRGNMCRAMDAGGDGAQPDGRLRLEIFKQLIEARVDTFEADVIRQMLQGPEKLAEAEQRFRSGVSEEVAQLVTAELPSAANVSEALQREVTRSLQSFPFRHLLIKESSHAT